eukprot:TRINITY_DN22798_c0_g1_i1.p1 TRINITY_DN22798_c0_g1~~TRINITY_DN22798_c0_g1_i1.p1  ORF type:complete len:371 (+),score=86.01 TRINITY_DN22798_c0_g1_i1:60-1115(+)
MLPRKGKRGFAAVYWMFGFTAIWLFVISKRYASAGEMTKKTASRVQEPPMSRVNVPPPKSKKVYWNGHEFDSDDQGWDFYGLNVPHGVRATDRIRDGQVRTDYDLAHVNASKCPNGYEYGPNPAYKFPEDNDNLFVTVSTQPRILFFPEIATEEEIQLILSQAAPKLQRSQVALTKEGVQKKMSSTQEVRTSRSTWIDLQNNGVLQNLHNRLSSVVGSSWHEPLNVLKYELAQHYDSHHDYFDPKYYGNQANNRMATFYLYLSDTEAGGATTIPRANAGPAPINFKEAACKQGIQVFPRKGSGVLFYDMRPDRSLDPLSLHGACDVEKGTKWGGPVWFRAQTPEGTGQSHM